MGRNCFTRPISTLTRAARQLSRQRALCHRRVGPTSQPLLRARQSHPRPLPVGPCCQPYPLPLVRTLRALKQKSRRGRPRILAGSASTPLGRWPRTPLASRVFGHAPTTLAMWWTQAWPLSLLRGELRWAQRITADFARRPSPSLAQRILNSARYYGV